MKTETEIAAMINAAALETFDHKLIAGALVRREVDQDGDPLLWITVLVEPDFYSLASRLTIGFASRLHSDLHRLGESAYPVLDYVLNENALRPSAVAA